MRQDQKLARHLTTAFTLALIVFPFLLYAYATYTTWGRFFGFFTQIDFIILIVCGFLGTYKTVLVNNRIRDDICRRLVANGYKVENTGYNAYRLNNSATEYSFY
jgi:hypothetical protein